MVDEVKLFGFWGSPFVRRVEIALKLKGVKYEYIEEDLDNKSPQLLQYNPIHKQVPMLLHNGKPIVESVIILEYIDETWPNNPILPQDPYERAIARFWAKFIDEKCVLAIWKACFSVEEKDREESIKEACENLKTLEKEVKDKKILGGQKIGLVDIVANYLGFWIGPIQEARGVVVFTKEKFPILHKWSEEYVNCNFNKENLPPRDKMIAFFRRRYCSNSK